MKKLSSLLIWLTLRLFGYPEYTWKWYKMNWIVMNDYDIKKQRFNHK